jgi:hypothetical protein
MDVRGVGAGLTGTELSSALRGLALKSDGLAALAGLAQSGDTITAMLGELSQPEVVRFLEIIERPLPPTSAARLEDLLGASVSAAAEGNVQQALVKLAEFAALDPRRAETLEREPGLASIRAEVGRLLFRLASAAQLDAELRLGQATHLLQATVQADGSKELAGQAIRPEIAILIAGRLLEAGGYANCMRSAELSQMSINQYGWAPIPAPSPPANPTSIPIRSEQASLRLRNQWMPRIRRLWLRAPLLVLLLAWFAVGLVGGCVFALLRNYWPQTWPESLMAGGFEVWGVGFLALIAFGFYAK